MADTAQRWLPVLTYHSIDETGSPVSTRRAEFARQIGELAAGGWRTISLTAVAAGLPTGRWPDRSMLLTFDDGYRNVLEHAAPVLARHGFTATVFVVSGLAGSTTAWPGPRSVRQDAPLLDWQQVRDLAAAGWAVGSHSRSHPRLTAVPPETAELEIAVSRREIEDRCAVPVEAFAYPYGDTSPALERMVEPHYRLAFGTRLALVAAHSRLTCLDRVDAYYLRRLPLNRIGTAPMRAYLAARRGARWVVGH